MILTTLSLTSALALATVDSDFDASLSLDSGTAYYVSPGAAGSEGSWYFKPGLGINMLDDLEFTDGVDNVTISFDNSSSLNLGLGMHVSDNMRLEVSYMEADNDIEGATTNGVAEDVAGLGVEQELITIQALFDLNPTEELSFYVGGGLTMADLSITAGSLTADTGADDTAFHFTAGLTWQTGDFNVVAEYRMFSASYEIEGVEVDADNSTLFLGLKWYF